MANPHALVGTVSRNSTKAVPKFIPKTVSLVPAKSIVLIPLLCWKGRVAAALGAVRVAAFTADTKVRRWTAGVANCLMELRRALLAVRDDIVRCGIGQSELRVEKFSSF